MQGRALDLTGWAPRVVSQSEKSRPDPGPKEAAVRAEDPACTSWPQARRSHAGVSAQDHRPSSSRQGQPVSSHLGRFLLHSLLDVITEGQLGVGNGAVVPRPLLESRAGISVPQSQPRQLGARGPAGHHPSMPWGAPLPASCA